MRLPVVVFPLACLAVPAAAQDNPGGPPRSDAKQERAILAALEAIEKKTAAVKSFTARYTRSYSRFGRRDLLKEEGTLQWKRVRIPPEDRNAAEVICARWEGSDENGPLLTLVRGREATVWRGEKKEKETTTDDPAFLHAARFGFPLIPADARTAFVVGGPETSPEFDGRYPSALGSGVPRCLSFTPRTPTPLHGMVSLLFDPETGLADRIRCDSNGWDFFTLDLYDWVVNPAIADEVFDRPDKPPEEKPGKAVKNGGAKPAAAPK